MIVQIGEIAVTSTVVHTPAGDIPLAGSTWKVNDYWTRSSASRRWAIVAAIAGFCVLTVFSLLFLLVKETVLQGTVQVTVTNGTRQYVARIPVHRPGGRSPPSTSRSTTSARSPRSSRPVSSRPRPSWRVFCPTAGEGTFLEAGPSWLGQLGARLALTPGG